MMHKVIRRSASITSSTVADPSTVTVRIESASTCDLNVQDVLTTSSSDDEDSQQLRQKQDYDSNNENSAYSLSSSSSRRHASTLGSGSNVSNKLRPSRLVTDALNSGRGPVHRPITAVSLPTKSSACDNEWDLDSEHTFLSSAARRNPSCPSIPPTNAHVKTSSQAIYTQQQVPSVFTTTPKCLGQDWLRPQPRRDVPKRAQSLVKSTTFDNNSVSVTTSIVCLTHDILLGSIRALQNERQLCKLSIDYLIDATNMRPDELARKANIGTRLQCHCGHTHSRCTLTLEFDQLSLATTAEGATDSSNVNNNNKLRELNRLKLSQLFTAVNSFIVKALQENKRVLIYGFELSSNSPLAVIAIQYLMLNDEQLSLVEATRHVQYLFPVIPLQHQQYPIMEKRFQDYLKQLDRRRYPRNFNPPSRSTECSNNEYETRQSFYDPSSNSSETTTTTSNSTPVTSWTTIPISINNNNNNNNNTNRSLNPSSARSAWDS